MENNSIDLVFDIESPSDTRPDIAGVVLKKDDDEIIVMSDSIGGNPEEGHQWIGMSDPYIIEEGKEKTFTDGMYYGLVNEKGYKFDRFIFGKDAGSTPDIKITDVNFMR